MTYENLTFAITTWISACVVVGLALIAVAMQCKSADLLLNGFFIGAGLSVAGCSVLAVARCFTK